MDVLSTAFAHLSVRPGRLRSRSDDIELGDWFVAVGGDNEVAAHIAESISRGAAGVFVDAPGVPSQDLVHQLPGLRTSLGTLMAGLTGHPSRKMTLVGVTGTNGKTSTVQLLVQAWEKLGVLGASIGTLGAGLHRALEPTGLTTPPVVEFHEYLAQFHRQQVSCVATELSSHALTQDRVAGVDFRIVAISNITRDHLDYHRTMSEYAAAKSRILHLPGVTNAVMNIDDPLVASMQPPPGIIMTGVSTRGSAGATVTAENIAIGKTGTEFMLRIEAEAVPIISALHGRFNVDNLTMAAGILHAQGHSIYDIVAALSSSEPITGRMQITPATPTRPRVIVDYAHTPDALSKAIDSSRPDGDGRLIVIFGCTGDRDRGKRPMMAAATSPADLVILTDDDLHQENGDDIIADTLPGFTRPGTVVIIRDRSNAIRTAIHMAHPQDTVLIAGKGHETTLTPSGLTTPFTDSAHAHLALETRPLHPPISIRQEPER